MNNRIIEAPSFENWLTDEMRRAYNVIKAYDTIESYHVDEFMGVFEKHINTITSTVLRSEFNNILNRYVQNLNMFTEQDKWENEQIDKMFTFNETVIASAKKNCVSAKDFQERVTNSLSSMIKEFQALPTHKQEQYHERFNAIVKDNNSYITSF